jgi:hypothetical protein
MSEILSFPKKQQVKLPISADEYIDALDAIEYLIEESHPDCLQVARPILAEMRFCAAFNCQFREETETELRELVDDLYAEAQDLIDP